MNIILAVIAAVSIAVLIYRWHRWRNELVAIPGQFYDGAYTRLDPPLTPPAMPAIQIKLVPFTTPNFVLVQMPPRPREHGITEAPKFALAELDHDTLSKLCDEFRADVFQKAGKTDPNS